MFSYSHPGLMETSRWLEKRDWVRNGHFGLCVPVVRLYQGILMLLAGL